MEILGAILTAYTIYSLVSYLTSVAILFVIALIIMKVSNGYFTPFFTSKWRCFGVALIWPKYILWDLIFKGLIAKKK
jgi:hypothetical protein